MRGELSVLTHIDNLITEPMNTSFHDHSAYYNSQARQLHQQWLREKSPADLLPFIEMLEPGARVLDLGCGNGLDLAWLTKAGFQGVGIESSAELASAARAVHAESGVEIREKNFLFMTLAEGEFGGVWANLSFSELPAETLQRLLAICFKGVKVGGVLGAVLLEGTGSFEEAAMTPAGAAVTEKLPTRKIHLYSEKALCSMFDQTGFQVMRVGRKKNAEGQDQILILAKRV
jgi:SAM-dependent methyltransferase